MFNKISKEILNRAYYWTSFDPEKRAERFNAEYEQAQIDFENFVNAQNITDEQKSECLAYWSDRLYKNAVDYLAAESCCISWAITGPAKFPVKKAEKAQASAEAKLNDYIYTLGKMKSAEIFNRYLTAEQKQIRVDSQKWREISMTLSDFVAYKKHGLTLDPNNWTFNAFPHLKGAFTTQAKNGNFAMCDKILEYLRERQAEGLKVEKNIKILSDILDDWKAKLATPQESTEKEVDGVRIVENIEENRLQLFFDGKPEADIIALLKQHAFKWSPRFKAWQRILTPNAKFALNKYILPTLTAGTNGEEC